MSAPVGAVAGENGFDGGGPGAGRVGPACRQGTQTAPNLLARQRFVAVIRRIEQRAARVDGNGRGNNADADTAIAAGVVAVSTGGCAAANRLHRQNRICRRVIDRDVVCS